MSTTAVSTDTLTERLAGLSPAKRALLELKLNKAAHHVSNSQAIESRSGRNEAPVSFNQEGLLFMEQLDPDTAKYNICDALRLTGTLNVGALETAIAKIVGRHDALRTVFQSQNGEWRQVVLDSVGPYFEHVELNTTAEESAAIELLQSEADRPIDISTGPLFKTLLVTTGQTHHVLVKMHHIVSDGWSIGVFWSELSEIYSALVQDRKPVLTDLPIQFGDYSDWTRQHLGREIDRQKGYWTEQLDGAPALLELPTDRPRSSTQSATGALEVVSLPSDLLEGAHSLCRREGTTLYMALLAAFYAVLSRYTGAKDLVVGTPIAGRTRTETENLIGFFVNTLALRAKMDGDPTFSELLKQVRGTVLDAFSHQDIPFDQVVAAIKPARSLSYNPIYQVAFALQESFRSEIELHGLSIEPVQLRLSTSKFDLFLAARESAGDLRITVEYSTTLFDRSTIRQFIDHYANVLRSAISAPGSRVSELGLLDDNEKHRIVKEWNKTSTDYPKRSVTGLFGENVDRYANRTAIAYGKDRWTYAKLDEWSNRVANYLSHHGVGPDGRVGVCLERSATMIATILGILKCGASYVPMDPANPPSRIGQMVEDAGPSILLTDTAHLKSIPKEISAEVIDLNVAAAGIKACSSELITADRDAEDPACILYTSGSTGKPKGAIIPHRAISRLLINTNYLSLGPGDRVAHISNVAFDAALFDIFAALLNGGQTVIFDKETVLSPKEFSRALKDTGITVMFLTTPLFHLMSRETPDAFSTLKTLLVGGEIMDPTALETVFRVGGPRRFVHVYGPTESTTFATWHLVDPTRPVEAILPIGRPLSNTTVYLLDENLNPVPPGVMGEVFIGGDGLATGYLNRPELNREKFVRIPAEKLLSSGDPILLYRTGDLARFRSNGDIEFAGRSDHQVKVRGFRMELGEIETVVESHPLITDALVIAIKDSSDHRLYAFYVLAPGRALSTDQLRGYLREKLPNYMVPASLIEVPAMPLNPNGKIDRKQLESMITTEADARSEQQDAQDELEVRLKSIWGSVLRSSVIGVHDNFFDLGGHSLAAVKVFAEIERSLGCKLPLATLFKAPTIHQLAELIRQGGWRSTWQSIVPVRTGGTNPPFFCVHAVGGNIIEYNELAGHLPPEQPFYGLQSVGLDGKSEPLTDIESMADAYLSEIREVQPQGPYFIGGRSFGGTVAYEMARRLVAEGEEVALLAIFDSYPKGWLKLLPPDEAERRQRNLTRIRMRRHVETWLALSITEKFTYVWTKLGFKSRKLKHFIWRVTQPLRSKTANVASTIRDIEEVNYTAIRSYTPEYYSGRITFFSAQEDIYPEENLIGWRMLAQGGVDVIEVPGDHQTMIKEPNAGELARVLQASIDRSMAEQAIGASANA